MIIEDDAYKLRELFRFIEVRPAMYLGAEHQIESLFYFLAGRKSCIYDYGVADNYEKVFIEKFPEFIASNYSEKRTIGWHTILRDASDTEAGALELFFSQLRDFEAKFGFDSVK